MKLRYKNRYSEFELIYIKWEGIHYDRDLLKKFVCRYNWVSILSKVFKSYKRELKILNKVIDHYGRIRIHNLLWNDELSSKQAHIERLSRIGSSEILTSGVYSPETYRKISNLSKNDFDLVTKRVEELIDRGQDVTTQRDIITENIPGDEIHKRSFDMD